MSNLTAYTTLCVVIRYSLFFRRMNAELEAKTSELVKEAEELLVSMCNCV